jgi:hydroxymethylpyrimidine/phosphomethylpyrimidine kinase
LEEEMKKQVALSIAGFDPSSGAGIQADVKSFSYLNIHGASVVTCIAIQNTKKVHRIVPLSVQVIEDQLTVLFEDFSINAVKTGMLFSENIIKSVTKKLLEFHIKPVVDPVMRATSGDSLSDPSYISSLKTHLLPQSLVVTANITEAEVLSGLRITTKEDVKASCEKLYALGPTYVLVKGGHLALDQAVDIVYDGQDFYDFSLPMIPHKKAHGSGCTLSALITGMLALGKSPLDSIQRAKHICWSMIQEGYVPGKGSDVLNHSSSIMLPPISSKKNSFELWWELKTAVAELLKVLPPKVIPEVGMNFVFAHHKAKAFSDICGIDGRIVKAGEQPRLYGSLKFGGSKHVASIVLAAMEYNPDVRSALNLRYSEPVIAMCQNLGFNVGWFERKKEPKKTRSTMEWGTKEVITSLGYVPDIIYDKGTVGKEPMIRVLGTTPSSVLNKVKKLLEEI